MTLLFACDRSGGHFYPAYACACDLKVRFPSWKIIFYGTHKRYRLLLRAQNFLVVGEDFGFRNLIFELMIRFLQSFFVFVWFRPTYVFGFGGRNSFWVVFLSALVGRSIVFEANAALGKANRVLARFCQKTFCGFPLSPDCLPGKCIQSGVVIRKDFFLEEPQEEIYTRLKLESGKFTIFILGGSQGSTYLNNLFLETTFLLPKDEFQVIHLTGKKDCGMVQDFYQNHRIQAFVQDFFEHTYMLYRVSQLVLCRAGALTLAELSYSACPAILFPLELAGGHQRKNALYLEKVRAAKVFLGDTATALLLAEHIHDFMRSPEKRLELSKNIYAQKLWAAPREFSEKVLSVINRS